MFKPGHIEGYDRDRTKSIGFLDSKGFALRYYYPTFIAFSIIDTGIGRLVSELTHFSETIVAMSLNMASDCACLSLSDT